ncbi:MAG: hypothetical protein Q9195_003873 [Heterodermia aff. obscurata]
MEAISVNAPSRHIRDRLPPKDPKQANLDWSAFEHTVKYLYETKQVTLAPETTWNQLSKDNKEEAIDTVLKQLEPLQLGWGELTRPIVKWRLYHCHRKSRIKVMRGKNAADDAETPTGEDETGEPAAQGQPGESSSVSNV